ncbi:MAG: hypothetical protein CM1200mP28_12920 [Deltaproteobacteria bacterium]|nr:MAG: hypothetical protein CM1200mP28_12920 [Deltaproteobacteria bacterium]
MGKGIEGTRQGLSSYAPRFITHKIAQDKIGTEIWTWRKNDKEHS